MAWLVGQIWILLLLAFAVGAFVGVWAATARKKAPEAGAAGASLGLLHASEPGILLSEPDGREDDLTQIIGLDEDTEKRLNGLGVFHLRQIAAWSPSEARWVEMKLNEPGRVIRERWPEQAQSLG